MDSAFALRMRDELVERGSGQSEENGAVWGKCVLELRSRGP